MKSLDEKTRELAKVDDEGEGDPPKQFIISFPVRGREITLCKALHY
jgi:hypothetical protein